MSKQPRAAEMEDLLDVVVIGTDVWQSPVDVASEGGGLGSSGRLRAHKRTASDGGAGDSDSATTTTSQPSSGKLDFVVYTLAVRYRDEWWRVHRRYSQFDSLYHSLPRKPRKPPRLPAKQLFMRRSKAVYDPDVVRNRARQLQAWLNAVLAEPAWARSALLLDWLQRTHDPPRAPPTVPAAPPPIKRGWLRKEGHLIRTVRRRWFTLDGDGTLSYFRSPAAGGSSSRLGVLHLAAGVGRWLPNGSLRLIPANVDENELLLFEDDGGGGESPSLATKSGSTVAAAAAAVASSGGGGATGAGAGAGGGSSASAAAAASVVDSDAALQLLNADEDNRLLEWSFAFRSVGMLIDDTHQPNLFDEVVHDMNSSSELPPSSDRDQQQRPLLSSSASSSSSEKEPVHVEVCRVCECLVPKVRLAEHSALCAQVTQLLQEQQQERSTVDQRIQLLEPFVVGATIPALARICRTAYALPGPGPSARRSAGALRLLLRQLDRAADSLLATVHGEIRSATMAVPLRSLLLEKLKLLELHLSAAAPETTDRRTSSTDNNGATSNDLGATALGSSGRITSTSTSGTGVVQQHQQQPPIQDYDVLKQISRGAFGRVFLARKRTTGDLFAIKVLPKSQLKRKNASAERVLAERNILSMTANPFVVRLAHAFQSQSSLYLVMEYLPGGDLAALLAAMGSLDVPMARVYAAEIVLGLDYLHQLGVIHRDLKPDNLLIDLSGHLKLTDFGLSTWDPSKRRTAGNGAATTVTTPRRQSNSIVGTPDYVAPEILMGLEHGVEVDWWSLGVVVYEMLVGVPPFAADTAPEIFANITQCKWSWPEAAASGGGGVDGGDSDQDPSACQFVDELLVIDPDQRLSRVRDHRFFLGLDWTQLLQRKHEAAFIPFLDSFDDTSYFARQQHTSGSSSSASVSVSVPVPVSSTTSPSAAASASASVPGPSPSATDSALSGFSFRNYSFLSEQNLLAAADQQQDEKHSDQENEDVEDQQEQAIISADAQQEQQQQEKILARGNSVSLHKAFERRVGGARARVQLRGSTNL